MEHINMSKSKEYEGGKSLEFKYEGIKTSTFDENKVEKLIETIISNEKLIGNIPQNISFLRTVLKDAKEKLLLVKYIDGKKLEEIEYHNGVLSLFQYKKFVNDTNFIEIDYDQDGFTIRSAHLPEIKEKFAQIIDYIDDLKNIGITHLNKDAKILIEVYKLFYNENPDFSKEDINIKMQTMVSILCQFDIWCGDYSFEFYDKMPESNKLCNIVYNLFPLGEIKVVDDPIELKDSVKKEVQIIGQIIRDTFGNGNINEKLITLSKAIYAGRYDITYFGVKKLIENSDTSLSLSDAKSSRELVKKINDKLK